MIKSRYFYLYLVCGFIALVLVIINVVMFYPEVKTSSIFLEILLMIFFFYLANKTYHEKKDKDLM